MIMKNWTEKDKELGGTCSVYDTIKKSQYNYGVYFI